MHGGYPAVDTGNAPPDTGSERVLRPVRNLLLTVVFVLMAAPPIALVMAAPSNTCAPVDNAGMECTGTSGDEWLTTGDGKDVLRGLGGDDRLNARSDADKAYGGSGNDTIHTGTGSDEAYGEGGSDVVLGDETGKGGADLVSGGRGNDRVFGLAGDDVVRGDKGNDVVHGGDGVDVMEGGAGNDTLDDAPRKHKDKDRFSGGSGNDEIFSRDGLRDTVNCGAGSDVAKADSKDKVASDCERVIRVG